MYMCVCIYIYICECLLFLGPESGHQESHSELSLVVHGTVPRNRSTESIHKRPYGTALGTVPRWSTKLCHGTAPQWSTEPCHGTGPRNRSKIPLPWCSVKNEKIVLIFHVSGTQTHHHHSIW